MKIEKPLFRRVEISFHDLEIIVEIWTTDVQIELINRVDWTKSANVRIQSSPWSIIEFRTCKFKRLKCTNEIRHQLSPSVQETFQKRKIAGNGISPDFSNVPSMYVNRSLAYFQSAKTDCTIVDFSGIPDWDLIFLTSLELVDEICSPYFSRNNSPAIDNLILVEHFF